MAGLAPPPAQKSLHGSLFSPLARGQYAALAWVQTRIFVNSLRTKRGGFELGARIVAFLVFGAVATGPSVGLGFGASIGLAVSSESASAPSA